MRYALITPYTEGIANKAKNLSTQTNYIMTSIKNIEVENYSAEQIDHLVSLLSELLKGKITQNAEPAPRQPQTFAERVDQKAEEQIQKKVKNYKKKINKVEYLNNCFRVAIEDHFDSDMTDLIIKSLDQGRKAGDWACMLSVYGKIKDHHKRQLILALSALYRMQFINQNTKDEKQRKRLYQLRSQLKYATICDTCGMIAREVTQYLERKTTEYETV